MESFRAPIQFKRFEGNPILSPEPAHSWESLVNTNPAAWIDNKTGKVMLLYRAAGGDAQHVIHFGLAESDDGLNFRKLSDQPVFSPSKDGFDGGCVEDPRVVFMDGWYVMTYALRPFPPGQYWPGPKTHTWHRPTAPDFFPISLRENVTATGLAFTQDFSSFIRAGRITDPRFDDRDVILFPEKVNNRFWMMHRPMTWTGPDYGTNSPAIWIKSSDDLLDWNTESSLLIKAEYAWEKKIGGNTPPIRTDAGWLTLYHGVGPDRFYRVGALLLDLEDPSKVVHRSDKWLLQPEAEYERGGFYGGGGVVFPCGKVLLGDTLHIYYGGADKYVGAATCKIDALLEYLSGCPAV